MKTSSLQFKVLLIAAGAMLFAVSVAVIALSRVYSSIEELDRISREDFQVQEQILRGQALFKMQVQEWKNVLLRGRDPAALEKHWAAFEKLEKDTAGVIREARSGTSHDEIRARLEGFLAAHKLTGERYRRGLEAFKAAKMDPAAGDNAVEGIDRGPSQSLADLSDKAAEIGSKGVVLAVQGGERTYRIAIAAIILAMVAACIGLWLFMRKAVLSPIGDAVRFAERISHGDLTVDIHSTSRDEAGQLLRMLGTMKVSLGEVVSTVRRSAENVVTASGQVSAGTTDLSQRTEEQASSLEETAASMEELASTVRQNADNARQADELARNASKRAEQGGAEVIRVVSTMTDISDSAKRITDIVSVIDSIAFQTNILALNAAVEAARAGEQGRGFAVVASEVRSLAQRSAHAAKEIKQLIGNSVQKVQAGTDLVEQAGDTIQNLVIDVKRVSDLMGSIAEASAEQSRGVQQVNKTVTEMDKVVQQNAAAVQESAAAAEGMRQQAEALVRAVSTFRLTESDLRAEPAAPEVESLEPPPGGRAPALAVARAKPAKSARSEKAMPAAAASSGDDWEEF
ncbi:MAG TPA: methyl-accepting chemotaxis protein [Usitatibacter sp.]|nr:methyl-accepting chemotaxis protein [Usitatibacter sp.]